MKFKYSTEICMGVPLEDVEPAITRQDRVFYRLIEPRIYGKMEVQYACVYRTTIDDTIKCVLREHPGKLGVVDVLRYMMQRCPGLLVDTTEAFPDRI